MAKSITVKDNLANMLECIICMDEYSDPRVLPCIHTFCLKCLKQMAQEIQTGANMACPICRSEFKIPENGIEGIQKNFFMESLINMHHLSTANTMKVPCDGCLEDSVQEVPSASMFCVECNQKLCDECCRAHRRSKASKQHQLIDLTNSDSSTITQLTCNLAQSFCGHHDNEPIKMFCFDCKAVNCLVCQVESHQGHKCSGIGKVSEEFRNQLNSSIIRISECFRQCNKEVDKIDEKNRLILDKIGTLESDVSKRAARLKEIVDEHMHILLQEINTFKMESQKRFEIRKEEVRGQLTMFESYQRYAEEIKAKGSSVDICRNFHDMTARADRLERSHIDFMKSSSNPEEIDSIKLIPSNFESILTGNVIGSLIFVNATENKIQVSATDMSSASNPKVSQDCDLLQSDLVDASNQSQSFQLGSGMQSLPGHQEQKRSQKSEECQLIKKFQIDGVTGLAGVTWLENRIYVVCDNSDKIRVFEAQEPYLEIFRERIEIQGMKRPYDMVASKVNRSIFISDYGANMLWKLQMPCKTISKGRIEGVLGRLSVNATGDSLIMPVGLDGHGHSLNIHRSLDVRKIESITLPFLLFIQKVWHAVQLSNGNFIVAYRRTRMDYLSEMSNNGKDIIRTFHIADLVGTKLNMDIMWNPVHLSIDKNNNILVADFGGDKIYLLNSEMTDLQILLDDVRHQIYFPAALCLVEDKQKLIVGQGGVFSGAAVSIFNFRS